VSEVAQPQLRQRCKGAPDVPDCVHYRSCNPARSCVVLDRLNLMRCHPSNQCTCWKVSQFSSTLFDSWCLGCPSPSPDKDNLNPSSRDFETLLSICNQSRENSQHQSAKNFQATRPESRKVAPKPPSERGFKIAVLNKFI
jgi:hypothetical protein